MKKLVSILLTLALAVSLLVVPAMVSAATYTFGGDTIDVTSIAPCVTLDEACFDAEPHKTVVDPVAFDAQSSPVTIEGKVSALVLGAGWVDTAYVEIGLRPDATKDERNAGVYLIAFNAAKEGEVVTWIHLQDYTGGQSSSDIAIPQNSDFSYTITLTPGVTGGTASLEVFVGGVPKGIQSIPYGCVSDWKENNPGALDEDFSNAHLFYSIIADRRGVDGATYSATVGDISITGEDVTGNVVVLTANVEDIVAINVDPSNVDFGTITPGTSVTGNPNPITVTNTGTVMVSVGASLDPTGGVFRYLYLNGADHPTSGKWDPIPGMGSILPTEDASCTTELQVPATYSAQGSETATLVFEVTALP